jgi:hypothetical protein
MSKYYIQTDSPVPHLFSVEDDGTVLYLSCSTDGNWVQTSRDAQKIVGKLAPFWVQPGDMLVSDYTDYNYKVDSLAFDLNTQSITVVGTSEHGTPFRFLEETAREMQLL